MPSFRVMVGLAFAAFLFAGSGALAQDEGWPNGYFVGTPVPFSKLPNSGRPTRKISFPGIVDWRTLKFTLERATCFGSCPVYRVEITADGTVNYKGHGSVVITEEHRAHVPTQAVRTLYDSFVKAEFFWTFDKYQASITDLPTYYISISFDGRTKRIVDYAGLAVGMPKEIATLEAAIDAVAETERWVKGNTDTFASLVSEHWNFHARDDEHLALIPSVADSGNIDLMRNLLVAGVDAKNKWGCIGLSAAAHSGNVELVKLLLRAHAPIHWESLDGDKENRRLIEFGAIPCDALRSAVESGVSKIVRWILELHPDVNWRGPRGETALMAAAMDYEYVKHKQQNYRAVAQLLIDAGADPTMTSNDGQTAMDICQSACEAAPVLKRWFAAHQKPH